MIRTLNRTQGLSRVSKQQAKAKYAMQKAYKVVDAGPRYCAACGITHGLTHSHVLTQKQFPQHRANPKNVMLLCYNCHATWENNKPLFATRHPDAFTEKMQRMQELEPQAAAVFRMKHSHLFTL